MSAKIDVSVVLRREFKIPYGRIYVRVSGQSVSEANYYMNQFIESLKRDNILGEEVPVNEEKENI